MANLPPNNLPEYDLEGTNEAEATVQEAVDQEVDIEDTSSEYESSEEDEVPIQQPSNQEIELTEGEIDLSAITRALETALEESRTPSLTSASPSAREDPFSEHVSEENTPVITRRNTMSSSSGPANPTHVTLTAEQFQALLANTRPPVTDRFSSSQKNHLPSMGKERSYRAFWYYVKSTTRQWE